MTAVPGAGPGGSVGAGAAGLGWATGGPAPAGMDPRARETIEHIVRAVRDGDDAAICTLLTDLAAVADTAALLYLRERLYPPR